MFACRTPTSQSTMKGGLATKVEISGRRGVDPCLAEAIWASRGAACIRCPWVYSSTNSGPQRCPRSTGRSVTRSRRSFWRLSGLQAHTDKATDAVDLTICRSTATGPWDYEDGIGRKVGSEVSTSDCLERGHGRGCRLSLSRTLRAPLQIWLSTVAGKGYLLDFHEEDRQRISARRAVMAGPVTGPGARRV